ncbi:S-adenosyl-L-methionine-dependent methyltransferase [Syncephalis pseudoplumigaleata]|uniref:S-adenosyl-L-methionine-dependent methyltransferase n=1 Tax=Syncephalis pseudoplumigaleata TaxID=1712513 RepID=A0A4P9YYZ6_9FUNG|nr:S-adenosyl-L-methionine-dependent methyltransferase [Syncephalis pseudoplumigaleata]|eukprot:RKP24250.1 S-adenosyl-L-methionine-dependent methyltransferase [Syncephalis pseudoplumigaleata]
MLNDDTANYLWPTDLDESDRLNTQHNIIRYVLRRAFLSPVVDPRRVLDVGCGTGMWMKEVARDFPKATLVGVDIADVFMQTDMPSNCTFELGNVLEGLAFSSNRFDFVHQRLMGGAIPASLWQAHVAELYRVTQSGGFLELGDTDFNFQNVGDIGYRVNHIVQECFAYRGLDLMIIRRLDKLMRRAGFVEIQVRIVEFPVGEWAGISGRMMRNNIDEALRSLRRLAVTIGMVGSEDEYDKLLDDLWQECDEHQTLVHAYFAYGQKP